MNCGAEKCCHKTGFAPVNGLKLYYEIHTRQPLILSHDGLADICDVRSEPACTVQGAQRYRRRIPGPRTQCRYRPS